MGEKCMKSKWRYLVEHILSIRYDILWYTCPVVVFYVRIVIYFGYEHMFTMFTIVYLEPSPLRKEAEESNRFLTHEWQTLGSLPKCHNLTNWACRMQSRWREMQHKNIHSQQANEIYASFNWLAWVCKDWLSRGSVILHIKTSSISKWNMRLQQPFANSNSWYLCSPCHPACECAGKSHGDRPARKISWQVCYARNIRKIRLNTWEITIPHYYMPWPCISIIACTILWVISATNTWQSWGATPINESRFKWPGPWCPWHTKTGEDVRKYLSDPLGVSTEHLHLFPLTHPDFGGIILVSCDMCLHSGSCSWHCEWI